jgi:alpha-L-rhamnosidase
MAPSIRALADGNRDGLLWDPLQADDQPSYGSFLDSTPANPGGMTTIGEHWTRDDSKNNMILAQIEEWFHAGLAGIRTGGAAGYGNLIFKPKPVGDLRYVHGSRRTPQGMARSSWSRSESRFELRITVPSNTTAEVWVPTGGRQATVTPARATFGRIDGEYAVYSVPAGQFTFTSFAGA